MAEEFVRKEHFEEFSVRIAERFWEWRSGWNRVLRMPKRHGSRTLSI